MKKLGVGLIMGLMLLVASGCGTIYNSDKITSIKTRCFGLIVETSSTSANATPSVKLGFISQVVQIIPTSTNKINSPNYMDTFDLGQGINPFNTTISEDTGTGNVVLDEDTHTIVTTNKLTGVISTNTLVNYMPYKLGARFQNK